MAADALANARACIMPPRARRPAEATRRDVAGFLVMLVGNAASLRNAGSRPSPAPDVRKGLSRESPPRGPRARHDNPLPHRPPMDRIEVDPLATRDQLVGPRTRHLDHEAALGVEHREDP